MSTRVPAQVPPWARPSPQSPRALGPATAQTEPGRQPRTGAARSLPPHCAETPRRGGACISPVRRGENHGNSRKENNSCICFRGDLGGQRNKLKCWLNHTSSAGVGCPAQAPPPSLLLAGLSHRQGPPCPHRSPRPAPHTHPSPGLWPKPTRHLHAVDCFPSFPPRFPPPLLPWKETLTFSWRTKSGFSFPHLC